MYSLLKRQGQERPLGRQGMGRAHIVELSMMGFFVASCGGFRRSVHLQKAWYHGTWQFEGAEHDGAL